MPVRGTHSATEPRVIANGMVSAHSIRGLYVQDMYPDTYIICFSA